MNYQKHYDLLIIKARNRTLEDYKEKHHIIPKVFGGDNSINNMVELTAREHYVAHILLYKLQKNKKQKFQMLKALVMMKGKNEFSNFNSKFYENAKIEFSKAQSKLMTENNPMKEKKHSEETKKKISIKTIERFKIKENHPFFGRSPSEESLIKNRESNSLTINIFDKNGDIKYVCKDGFENFCKRYNLPFKVLKKSYQNNGEYKLYSKFKDKRASPLRKEEYLKFTGWFAKIE